MSVLMSRTRHHKSATNASSRSSPAAPERDISCITCLNLKRPLFRGQTLVLAEQAECQQRAGEIWLRNGLLREPAGQGLALGKCCPWRAKWCPGAESNHRHCDFQSFDTDFERPIIRGWRPSLTRVRPQK